MISQKTIKPVVVQSNKAALLSSAPIRYVPVDHVLLGADVTSAVVFSQLEFLWRKNEEKIAADKLQKVDFTLSYSQLIKYHFPWMTRRNLMINVKWLEQIGMLTIARPKKKKNCYAINQWKPEHLEKMAPEIAFDPNSSSFILIFPQLACLKVGNVKLGLICAIMLQRIHYMSRDKGLIVISQMNIRKYMFNCVCLKTIQRSIRVLVTLGILVSEEDEDEIATIYGIDYERLQKLIDANFSTETLGEFDDVDEILAA